MNEADDALFHAAGSVLDTLKPAKLGVAVSGGSDSVAALNILSGAARARGLSVAAVTVNHGLREEAENEAEFVAQLCAKLNIRHDIRRWQDWDGAGNLQAQAREARYGLIATWARETGVTCVVLGHTRDDQAETFLMRLARGAGVDGLSEMEQAFTRSGVQWSRPFIRTSRAAMRAHLLRQGLKWIDDPSNDDPQFERVRMRNAMTQFEDLGLTPKTLSASSQNLSAARDALDFYVRRYAQDCVSVENGDLLLRHSAEEVPFEIHRRLIAQALRWMSGSGFAPRASALELLQSGLDEAGKHVLSGCQLVREGHATRITREWNAVRDLRVPVGQIWDNRWKLEGPVEDGLMVQALGEEGLNQCPDWRSGGMPRASLLASPSVWRSETLVSAPFASMENGWKALLSTDFHEYLRKVRESI